MGWAAMVVLIVLIVTIGKVLSRRYAAIDRDAAGADAMRVEGEMRQLKQRIAVLERVITDNHGSLELDREIGRLRDDNRE